MHSPHLNPRSIKTIREALNHLDHPSALEIHKWIRTHCETKSLGVTTVYRALKKLVQDGEIRPLSFFEGEIRYDRNTEHKHFICTACKKIDVIATEEPKVELPEGQYKLLFYNFDMFGLCAECVGARESACAAAR